jgi:hypothetical protein
MGFGGGGSGSFVLPNHEHTNAVADGGELDQTLSLMNGVIMQTWRKAVLTKQEYKLGSTFTTSSLTLVDVTAFTLTMLNNTGKFSCTGSVTTNHSVIDGEIIVVLSDGGVDQESIYAVATVANRYKVVPLAYVGDNDGQVLKLRMKIITAGNGNLIVSGDTSNYMEILEIDP